MIHYHGTPITPRTALDTMAGCSFCVSFSAPGQVSLCHDIGSSVMLDCGAYAAWRSGAPVADWTAYYAWSDRWIAYRSTWAVIPDVIDGDELANDMLISEWPHGDRGSPVWHMHESLGRLARLVGEWPRVCIGSSGQYDQIGTARWRDRMAAAMGVACDDRGRPQTWIHMMRGLALCGSIYPFASADSANVGRNYRSARRWPRMMADEIDARQCRGTWDPQYIQASLFTEDR